MFNYLDISRFKNILIIILCSILAISYSSLSYAGAAEKWDYKVTPDRSKNIINVTAKNISTPAANDSVYKIRLAPSKATVARTMMRRLFKRANPLIAITTIAVEELITGLGWKIDDENQIIYRDMDVNNSMYQWICQGKYFTNLNQLASCVVKASADVVSGLWDYKNPVTEVSEDGKVAYIYADRYDHATGILIAGKVLLEASRGILNNQEPINKKEILTEQKLAEEMFGFGEAQTGQWIGVAESYLPISGEVNVNDEAPNDVYKALEQSNPLSSSNEVSTENKPNGSVSVLPDFCSWATAVCEFFNWAKEPVELSESEPNEIQEEKLDILLDQMHVSYIKGRGYCPQDNQIPIDIAGLHSNITLSYQPFCSLATQARPAVILIAWVVAAFIVTGTSRKASED